MNGRRWWALLVLSLLVVAGRALLAAQGALRPTAPRASFAAGGSPVNPVTQSVQIDSILAAVSPPPRNPFAAPPPPPTPIRARGTAVPPVEPAPRVVLFMEDVGGATVQLEVGGETSGQMKVGSAFRGWTVQAITATGVAVVKGKRQLLLPRP